MCFLPDWSVVFKIGVCASNCKVRTIISGDRCDLEVKHLVNAMLAFVLDKALNVIVVIWPVGLQPR